MKRLVNMRLFSSACVCLMFFALFSYASEKFSGIGVALYKSNRGATVAAVAKNSPAAKSDLRVGDCIVKVDAYSLKGKSLVEIRNLIRGEQNMPISLGVLRGNDSIVIEMRRIDMSVVNVKDSVEAKNVKCNQCELLDYVSTRDKNAGFYVQKKADMKGADENLMKNNQSVIRLNLFSRKKLGFKVSSNMPLTVSLFAMDGSFIKRKHVSDVKVGKNEIVWDNTMLPVGQYTIQLEQDGVKSLFVEKLLK